MTKTHMNVQCIVGHARGTLAGTCMALSPESGKPHPDGDDRSIGYGGSSRPRRTRRERV